MRPVELSRNAKPRFAFRVPDTSVMAGAKHQKPVVRGSGQQISVVGRSAGRAESDRRHAMRLARI